jgi:hypothetical protein
MRYEASAAHALLLTGCMARLRRPAKQYTAVAKQLIGDPVIGQGEDSVMWELRERAQGLVEYGLIIALVAVLAIAGLIIFGPAVTSLLSRLGGSV